MYARLLRNILLIFAFTTMVSCDDNKVYDEFLGFENNVWESDDIKEFSFEVTDTISQLNLWVNLRTTTDYAYENIYMFLKSEYPNGESALDTLEFILAQPDGKWNGEKSGTIIEFHSLIASGGRFDRSGTYSFSFQHAMRESSLKEIVDIGFRVETKDL
ncbi:gliding motility lipoprotein GldH [Crocinitomix catalasitica]|uniref:gliding motility lipoprotein GldH n=1 Tax=Crocinitomix catalasitica TaxID=184607 RepID=UPI0009077A82|nr:gliding motility lipoprotein GldH [Crocinitomix catalasitica]